MDKKQLYTALSRTTKFEHLHVDKLNERYWIKKNTDIIARRIKFTEYKTGKIYRVKFDNGKFYIGSTKNTIEARLAEHLNDVNSVVYKNKKYNPKIELICDYPCYDQGKLEQCERHYINLEATEHLLNVRMNDFERKKKQTEKNSRFECYVQKESELFEKMKQKYDIKDDVKESRLRICFKEDGKTKNIQARYTPETKDKVKVYMDEKHAELVAQLTLSFCF